MRREWDKGEIEKAIFEEFAGCGRLQIIPGSVQKREPPEPDILCTLISGERVAFELAEACAPEFAAARTKSTNGEPLVCWGEDVSDETLLKKLSKTYSTVYETELLLYTNGLTALTDDVLKMKLQPLLRNYIGPYKRVWLFGDEVHLLAGAPDTRVRDDRRAPPE